MLAFTFVASSGTTENAGLEDYRPNSRTRKPTGQENTATALRQVPRVDFSSRAICSVIIFQSCIYHRPAGWLVFRNILFVRLLVVRFVSCPSKMAFCRDFKTLVDATALIPYYATLFKMLAERQCSDDFKSSTSLAFLRVIRLVRIFKLTKHSLGLQASIPLAKTKSKAITVKRRYRKFRTYRRCDSDCHTVALERHNNFNRSKYTLWQR